MPLEIMDQHVGIGSKSPFALTDTFTVISNHSGNQIIATAYLDGGVPNLAIISESPTDQPNGTTVSIPVADPDSQSFLQKEAHKLFKYWSVKPTITLGEAIPFDQLDYQLEDAAKPYYTDSFYLYDEPEARNLLRAVVVGMFKYKIPESLARRIESTYKHELPNLIKQLDFNGRYRTAFTFVLPANSLELSPSRETVEDTPANAAVVFEAFKSASNDMVKDILSLGPALLNDLNTLFSEPVTTLQQFLVIHNKFYSTYTEDFQKLFDGYLANSRHLPDNIRIAADTLITNPYRLSGFRKYSNGTYSTTATLLCVSTWVSSIFDRNNIKEVYQCKLNRKSLFVGTSVNLSSTHDHYYFVNTPTAKQVAKYANYNNVTSITYNGTQILIRDIICTDHPNLQTVINKLAPIATELPLSLFDTPKVSATRNGNTTRRPSDQIKIFNVLFSNINLSGKVSASEFYSAEIPANAEIIILQHSVSDIPADYWNEALSSMLLPFPVLVLHELKPERPTKRFITFAETHPNVSVKPANIQPEWGMRNLLSRFYASNTDHFKRIYLVNSMLSWSTSYSDKSYRELLNNSPLKYYRKLLPLPTYKFLIRSVKHSIQAVGLKKTTEALVYGRTYCFPNLHDHLSNPSEAVAHSGVQLVRKASPEQLDYLFQHPTLLTDLQQLILGL